MKIKYVVTTFFTAMALTLSSVSIAEGLTKKQVTELKKHIRSYLLENPGVIEEALIALQEKKVSEKQASAQKAIQENQDKIFKNEADPVIGNTTGKQKLVAFLDPFCGHCRAFKKILLQAIESNQSLKVIIKDFPILGNVAVLGTKAMLAAHQQGFYTQMQEMIYKAAPSLNENEVITLAKTIDGIDLDKFKKDLNSDQVNDLLKQTHELAKSIGISATPTLIIGDTLIEGGLPLEALEKLLKENEAASKKD